MRLLKVDFGYDAARQSDAIISIFFGQNVAVDGISPTLVNNVYIDQIIPSTGPAHQHAITEVEHRSVGSPVVSLLSFVANLSPPSPW